jgi:hypothetical protein
MPAEASPKIFFRDKFHMLGLLYDMVFLDGRRRAGMPLSPSDQAHLALLIDNFQGDTPPARRRHRRMTVLLPAVVKTGMETGRCTILNISAGGMLLASSAEARVGEALMVKVSRPGGIQYSFPCTVIRARQHNGVYQLAVCYSGIPLELRFGCPELAEAEPMPEPLRNIA